MAHGSRYFNPKLDESIALGPEKTNYGDRNVRRKRLLILLAEKRWGWVGQSIFRKHHSPLRDLLLPTRPLLLKSSSYRYCHKGMSPSIN